MAAVLCAVQGRVQQMAGVAQCRARPMLLEHADCKKKGDVACEAMDALAEDRAEQLADEALLSSDVQRVRRGRDELREGHGEGPREGRRARLAREDGDRAESLAITEDDFNKMLSAGHEEAQDCMNAPAGQPSVSVSSISGSPNAACVNGVVSEEKKENRLRNSPMLRFFNLFFC